MGTLERIKELEYMLNMYEPILETLMIWDKKELTDRILSIKIELDKLKNTTFKDGETQ